MHRRQFVQSASALLAGLAAGRSALAADPTTRIVVGFSPGGSTDVLARNLAEPMGAALGRTVLVENKTGASGRIAIEAVKTSAADGQALVLVPHGAMTLFPHIYKSLKYDPSNDFTPISRVSQSDYAIAVSAASPARDLKSFATWAKSQPDGLAFGSPGAGTVLHFLGLRIAHDLGLSMTHIPYRGAAPALTDLIGGAVQAAVTPLGDLLEMHRAGKVRIIATTGAQRSPLLEGVPTAKEGGVDVDVTAWTALYGPAGLPAPLQTQLHDAVQKALASKALQARMLNIAMTAAPDTPAQLAALQRSETTFWAQAVQASGFQPEA